jgi:hypothetical protein
MISAAYVLHHLIIYIVLHNVPQRSHQDCNKLDHPESEGHQMSAMTSRLSSKARSSPALDSYQYRHSR